MANVSVGLLPHFKDDAVGYTAMIKDAQLGSVCITLHIERIGMGCCW